MGMPTVITLSLKLRDLMNKVDLQFVVIGICFAQHDGMLHSDPPHANGRANDTPSSQLSQGNGSHRSIGNYFFGWFMCLPVTPSKSADISLQSEGKRVQLSTNSGQKLSEFDASLTYHQSTPLSWHARYDF